MNVRRRSILLALLASGLLGIAPFVGVIRGAPPASPSRGSARRESAERAAKAKPFAPEKLLHAFRGNREDVRQRALDEAERHLDEMELADTLWQVIEPGL